MKRLTTGNMDAITNALLQGDQQGEAVSIAVRNGAKILFLQRRDTGLWTLPGGMANQGETVYQAAVRELEEETGIVPKELTNLGSGRARSGVLVNSFLCDFRESPTDYKDITTLNDPDEEARGFEWFEPGTIRWEMLMQRLQHPENVTLKLLRLV